MTYPLHDPDSNITIPQATENTVDPDILTARQHICNHVHRDIRWQYMAGRHDSHSVVRAIVEAIKDEREACASIAEQYARHCKTESERTLCDEIGIAIRYHARDVGDE